MTARSYLYVPGDRPDRLEKAFLRAGDAVLADLEDAVRPDRKELALDAVVTWLSQLPTEGPEVWVRIGPGPRSDEELAAVGASPRLTGVLLAKADAAVLRQAAAVLPERVVLGGLVETAAAVLDLPAIARLPRVRQLSLGEADLAAELRIERDEVSVLGPLRAQLVVASSAAGIGAPTAPVHLALRDTAGLRETTERFRRSGFGARSALHPDQVPVIEEVLTPSAEEIARAREVVAAWDTAGGGVAVDAEGRLIDEAIVRPARRTVATAQRLGL